MNKVLALFLSIVILLSLCGCKNKDEDLFSPSLGADEVLAEGQWNGLGGCFTRQILDVGASVLSGRSLDETLYLLTEDSRILRFTSAAKTVYEAPDEVYITCFDVSADAIWLAERQYLGGGGTTTTLKKLSPKGELLLELPLPDNAAQLTQLTAGLDGFVYGLLGDCIVTFDESGSQVGSFTAPEGINFRTLFKTAEGKVLAQYFDLQKQQSVFYSPDGGAFAQTDMLGGKDFLYTQGLGGFSLCYSNGDGLYGLQSPEEEAHPIIIWPECGMSFLSPHDFTQGVQGSFYCIDEGDLWQIFPADPGAIKPAKVLKLATLFEYSNLNDAVHKFNSSQSEAYIQFVNYGDGVSLDDALSRLNLDLLSGKNPDMLDPSGLNIENYASKGLLADMYSLIDSDYTLKREEFLIAKMMESDGALYTMPLCFSLNTAYGLASRFGDVHGWSFDEYAKIEASLGANSQMCYNSKPEYFLEQCLNGYLSHALDFKNASCDFDNEEFISILEASKRIPIIDEYAGDGFFAVQNATQKAVAEGRLIYATVSFTSPSEYAALEPSVGADISFIGWPSVDGHCTSEIYPLLSMCIFENSDSKELCWEFLKSVLLSADEEGAAFFGFPVLKYQLERKFNLLLDPSSRYAGKEVTPAENGGCYIDGEFADFPYDELFKPKISQKQVDKFYALLDSISTVPSYHSGIREIVLGEAQSFLSGQRSAQGCAKLIEQRVGLLMSEQS